MDKFSCNKDIDILILTKLPYRDLQKIRQVNKYFDYLFNLEVLWINKIIKDHDYQNSEIQEIKQFLNFTAKELYASLSSFVYQEELNMSSLVRDILNEKEFISKIVSMILPKKIPKWLNKDEITFKIRQEIILDINERIGEGEPYINIENIFSRLIKQTFMNSVSEIKYIRGLIIKYPKKLASSVAVWEDELKYLKFLKFTERMMKILD